MANELRVRSGFLGGLIEDNPLSSSATTLTSGGLASVPVIGSTQHMAVVLDPDGFNGAPEVVYITAHSAATTTATIVRGQEGSVARAHDRDVPWVHSVTVKDFDASGGGTGCIGLTTYRAASNSSYAITSTSAAMVDVDATNLIVTFTAPPSGKVLVRLESLSDAPNTGSMHWGLRDGSGLVSGSVTQYVGYATAVNDNLDRRHVTIPVTGLTSGTSYTVRWAARVTSGTGTLYNGSDATNAFGTMIMEVWAVNV